MATKILPISDLRRQATGIIKALREEGDVVYITQHGRPSAVLIDYEEYEALLAQLKDGTDSTIRCQPLARAGARNTSS